jgi:hypothetical protein
MPCCGGKKGGKPISRLQFAVGRVIFLGIRTTLRVALGLAARVSPRFVPIARFWELLSADWERAIARREGIVLAGEVHDAACPLAPPSHRDATAGDPSFGRDWGDETLLPEVDEDEPEPAHPSIAAEPARIG